MCWVSFTALEWLRSREGWDAMPDARTLIRVTAMPADTNPYGGVFGGWLMSQMALAAGSLASRQRGARRRGRRRRAAVSRRAESRRRDFGLCRVMRAGPHLDGHRGRSGARERDGEEETNVASGDFTFVALDQTTGRARSRDRKRNNGRHIDLIVLGSGPGGYVAAIRAAQLGLKTAIVERENLGGICLNWGCIPTKALLRSAEVFHYMKHADAYGLSAGKPGFDLATVVARSRAVWPNSSTRASPGLMKKNKIAVHMGDGALTGAGQAERHQGRQGHRAAAKHIIVATGARARDLPFAKADGERIWTYRHAMVPKRCRPNCWSSARARSGSSSPASTTIWAPRSPSSKCSTASFRSRIRTSRTRWPRSLTKQGMTLLTGAGVESLKTDAKGVVRDDQDQGRQERPSSASATPSSRSGSSPTPRISGSRNWA